MDLLIQVGLLVIGFFMLVKGADYFVDGAAGVATKFGITQLVVGLTIVAMGTSAPEAAVSIIAGINGSNDIDGPGREDLLFWVLFSKMIGGIDETRNNCGKGPNSYEKLGRQAG